MTDSTGAKQKPPHLFKPGQSGNPKGRPKGSRNKLSEDFLAKLYEDWQANGVEALAAMRAEKPAEYVKVVASLVPKELKVTHESDVENMTTQELLAALVELVPADEIGAALERAGTTSVH